jgi:hypothetical protein
MRLFQNAGLYPAYRERLKKLIKRHSGFAAMTDVFLSDRYGACHLLDPVLKRHRDAFFTNADFEPAQRAWAKANGLSSTATLDEILLAQVEEHRTEVFYNSDPLRFGNDFLKKLPASVKCSIAWRSAPSGALDLSGYDLVVCNFPSILLMYQKLGWRSAYLAPAHDPVMDEYATNGDRPIDVLFVGSYSRHHCQRAETLEHVAGLADQFRIEYRLTASKLTRIAELPLMTLFPFDRLRRPISVSRISGQPVYGRQLYELLSRAKIVLNGAVDMAGSDRGNMRCFEAMGCGSLMLSDSGIYPDGMVNDQTVCTYANSHDAVQSIDRLLADHGQLARIAHAGHELMVTRYSKRAQWERFHELVEDVV